MRNTSTGYVIRPGLPVVIAQGAITNFKLSNGKLSDCKILKIPVRGYVSHEVRTTNCYVITRSHTLRVPYFYVDGAPSIYFFAVRGV